MRRQASLCVSVLALALTVAGAARAQWVVPCDPSLPRGFSCWPAPALFEKSRVAEAPEEEQEPLLMFIQEREFQAPEPEKHHTPSLAEMAAMSNYPQPIIMQVYYFDEPQPSHRHRSFTEWRLDCQDRLEHCCQQLIQGLSSCRHRAGDERSCCPCPE